MNEPIVWLLRIHRIINCTEGIKTQRIGLMSRQRFGKWSILWENMKFCILCFEAQMDLRGDSEGIFVYNLHQYTELLCTTKMPYRLRYCPSPVYFLDSYHAELILNFCCSHVIEKISFENTPIS